MLDLTEQRLGCASRGGERPNGAVYQVVKVPAGQFTDACDDPVRERASQQYEA
jgi:hypothetical protein